LLLSSSTRRRPSADTPSAGEAILLAAPRIFALAIPRPCLFRPAFNIDPVSTDEHGEFTFTNVPPGDWAVVVVRHKTGSDGKLIEAVHEWKAAVQMETGQPIQVAINLPESSLSKPVLRPIPRRLKIEKVVLPPGP
jgi:hypothetical protein